jgi:hypothetical protein
MRNIQERRVVALANFSFVMASSSWAAEIYLPQPPE